MRERAEADEDMAGFLAGCVLMLVVYAVLSGGLYMLWYFKWITWG